MDGGYIYGGENTPGWPPTGIQGGMVVKLDSEGTVQWVDYVYETHDIQSIRQISTGGYIACGGEGTGTLIRYEPETGISEPDPSGTPKFEVFPNPCNSVLSVSFNLPEAGIASVRVFDLSGRLVSLVADRFFSAGGNTVEWVVPDDASSGCYLIQYNAGLGSVTETIVLIKF